MAERICPTCGRGILTRCGRKGPWEKYVLPLFGVFPWRCGRCRTRLRLSDRGGAAFQRLPKKRDYLDEAPSTEGKVSLQTDPGPADDVRTGASGKV